MMTFDASGIYGELINYMMTIWFAGSAFFIFLYLWKSDKLGLDEEAKWSMLEEGENDSRRKP